MWQFSYFLLFCCFLIWIQHVPWVLPKNDDLANYHNDPNFSQQKIKKYFHEKEFGLPVFPAATWKISYNLKVQGDPKWLFCHHLSVHYKSSLLKFTKLVTVPQNKNGNEATQNSNQQPLPMNYGHGIEAKLLSIGLDQGSATRGSRAACGILALPLWLVELFQIWKRKRRREYFLF